MKVVFNAKLYYFIRYTNIFNNKTHCKEGITLVRNILFYRKLFIGVNKFSNFKANSLLSVNCLTSRICRCPCGVVLAVEKRFKNILEMSRARLNERHSNGFWKQYCSLIARSVHFNNTTVFINIPKPTESAPSPYNAVQSLPEKKVRN